MRPDNPMRNFDPRKVAFYEKENYVAYYQKDWFKLLRVSVGLVKASFALSVWQAIRGAYLVARAEIAFAPFPVNDVPKAEAYMRRFYQMIKDAHHEDFDVERAAQLEVKWWIVHRKLFGNAENQELVNALANLYIRLYRKLNRDADSRRKRRFSLFESAKVSVFQRPKIGSLLITDKVY